MVIFLESIVLCLLFTIAVPLILMRNPIKGIMSYPPAIRKRIEGLPQYHGTIRQEEKVHIGKKLFAFPLIELVLALVCWLSGARTFFDAFLHSFGLFLVMNLLDLVVFDWLWFCHSPRVRLPDTEDMDREYRNPWFHLRGFFIGVGIGVIISLLSSGI